jgi:hypothetical protein
MGFPGKSQGKQAGGKGSDYVDRAEKPQEWAGDIKPSAVLVKGKTEIRDITVGTKDALGMS